MKCRGRKTWGECVKNDIELLCLQPELAIFFTPIDILAKLRPRTMTN